jgi:phosphohistidine phosphatase SixA
MRVALVRHACAGRKEEWSGPDDDRPLDPNGVEQASALAEFFAGRRIRRLLSSPTLRCFDSLAELARRTGLPIETTDGLRTDVDPEAVRALITDAAQEDAVLCTHGETMRALLDVMWSEGLDTSAVDTEELLQKGSVWLLTVSTAEPAGVVALEHHMPAAVRACSTHVGSS